MVYLIDNESYTIKYQKLPYFSSNIFLSRNTAFSEPLFCINIQQLYIYTFSSSPHKSRKQAFPHHLCTTVFLCVHKCRAECSQPIDVVVNNRRSECSHGESRLFTNGNEADFTVLPPSVWIYRICSVPQAFGFTK